MYACIAAYYGVVQHEKLVGGQTVYEFHMPDLPDLPQTSKHERKCAECEQVLEIATTDPNNFGARFGQCASLAVARHHRWAVETGRKGYSFGHEGPRRKLLVLA